MGQKLERVLTEAEARKLVKQYRNAPTPYERNSVYKTLSTAYARLFNAIASKYAVNGLTKDDIRQECLITLLLVIDRYRSRRPDGQASSFVGSLNRACKYHVYTLLKQTGTRGRKDVKILSLDVDQMEDGEGKTLGDMVADPHDDYLDVLAQPETLRNVLQYVTPLLSPNELAVYMRLIHNRVDGPDPDYQNIADAIGADDPKQIDNAIGRIKRKMRLHKREIEMLTNGHYPKGFVPAAA